MAFTNPETPTVTGGMNPATTGTDPFGPLGGYNPADNTTKPVPGIFPGNPLPGESPLPSMPYTYFGQIPVRNPFNPLNPTDVSSLMAAGNQAMGKQVRARDIFSAGNDMLTNEITSGLQALNETQLRGGMGTGMGAQQRLDSIFRGANQRGQLAAQAILQAANQNLGALSTAGNIFSQVGAIGSQDRAQNMEQQLAAVDFLASVAGGMA